MRVYGLGLRVDGLGFRVLGLGFGVQVGLRRARFARGLRVEGLGCVVALEEVLATPGRGGWEIWGGQAGTRCLGREGDGVSSTAGSHEQNAPQPSQTTTNIEHLDHTTNRVELAQCSCN